MNLSQPIVSQNTLSEQVSQSARFQNTSNLPGKLVPRAGIEPARRYSQPRILSPISHFGLTYYFHYFCLYFQLFKYIFLSLLVGLKIVVLSTSVSLTSAKINRI